MRFQTHLPTIALKCTDTHQGAVTIPAGKMMNIVGRGEDERFLVVEVDGGRFQIFESDLERRCTASKQQRKRSAALSAEA